MPGSSDLGLETAPNERRAKRNVSQDHEDKSDPEGLVPAHEVDEFTPGKSAAASGRSLPVDYEMEGILLANVEVGKSVHVARQMPSGAVRIFTSSPVISVQQGAFATANSFYRLEVSGKPGEFAPLAEILMREIQDP